MRKNITTDEPDKEEKEEPKTEEIIEKKDELD